MGAPRYGAGGRARLWWGGDAASLDGAGTGVDVERERSAR